MPTDDDVDKRIYQRLPRTFSAEVAKLCLPLTDDFSQAVCCDISVGGLCLETSSIDYVVGDICQIKVTIPLLNRFSQGFLKVYENDAEQFFLALAEVAWIKVLSEQILVGCKFVNVDKDQKGALEKLIERAFSLENT